MRRFALHRPVAKQHPGIALLPKELRRKSIRDEDGENAFSKFRCNINQSCSGVWRGRMSPPPLGSGHANNIKLPGSHLPKVGPELEHSHPFIRDDDRHRNLAVMTVNDIS